MTGYKIITFIFFLYKSMDSVHSNAVNPTLTKVAVPKISIRVNKKNKETFLAKNALPHIEYLIQEKKQMKNN